MRKIFLLGAAGVALIAAPIAVTQTPFFAKNTQNSAMTVDSRGVLTMAPLLERVTPAVVSIRTEAKEPDEDEEKSAQEELFERFFGRQMPQQRKRGGGLGSGVIVDADAGYILTNHHVVDEAGEILVVLQDKRELVAELVGGDEKTDIAVLKIKAKNLRDVDFAPGDSTKVGDYVVAIGNPFGLGHTVTSGIVSALGREISRNSYQDFVQTDASINPGNSGGALVNSKGELVGINSAILSRSGGNNGIGFAVPSKMARSVMNQLVEHGEVKRGRIGVQIADITPDFKEAWELSTMEGAFVQQVTEDSPAERAGLKAQDIIIRFDGEVISDSSDIRNAVGLVEPGKRYDLTYLRGGKRITTKIDVEAFDSDEEEEAYSRGDSGDDAEPQMEKFSGATITNIPSEMELRGGDKGVLVAEVERGSRAFRAGLAKGDVIRKVGRVAVSDLSDFEDEIAKKKGAVALTVERGGQTRYVAVR